jgi:hypothetical protein
MPRLRAASRLALAPQPLSVITARGLMSGPMPSRVSNWRLSLASPLVRWKSSGRPSKSVFRWILVENPPRERPRAWPSCPPLAPADETCARTAVLSNIWTRCAVRLNPASAWKNASNAPVRLSRQKRFQIVCTQSTKRLARTIGAGREDVADLDIAVGDDHAVDEEVEQRALALEISVRQALADAPAESLGLGGEFRRLILPLGLGEEVLLLALQRQDTRLGLAPPPFVLGERDNAGQISLGQPLDLLAKARAPTPPRLARRACHSCGSQWPPRARSIARAIICGCASTSHRSAQTRSSSGLAGM